jgi:cobyrinic acid a,c-diamide synthase
LGPHAWAPQGASGLTLRGHSFHWSRFDTPLVPWQRTTPARGAAAGDGEPIFRQGALKASWFHPWFASAPAVAAQLFLPD